MAIDESGVASALLQHLGKYFVFYLIVSVVFQFFVRPIFFSPLSKYPGPLLAKFSGLWQLNVDRSRNRHLIYHAAHKKYGRVFRDGPNSLSFNDGTAVQRIYGTGKSSFPRSGSFQAPGVDYEHPPVFFALSSASHTRSRRMINNAYSMSSMLIMEKQVDKLDAAFEERLDEEASSGRIFDMSKWVNYFTLDVISDLAYGDAFGFLETGQDVSGIMKGMQEGNLFFAAMSAFPWLGKILCSKPMQTMFKLPEDTGLGLTMKIGRNLVEQRYRYGSEKKDLLNAFMAAKNLEGEAITKDQVLGEVMATLVAGGDTTANSICGILGFLLQNPPVLSKLQAEIDGASAQERLSFPIPTYTECAKLPYLDAVILPADGAEVLPGDMVPGGTIVGVNNLVLGRNQDIYGANAEIFKPERWLNEASRKKFKEHDFAFGHGARVCIGKNLAYVELYKVIASMVRKYNIKAQSLTNRWKEEQKLFLYKTDFNVMISRRAEVGGKGANV